MLEERHHSEKNVASNKICDAMKVISNPLAKPYEVGDTGQKLFINMYGGTRNDNLITKSFALRTCAFHKYQVNQMDLDYALTFFLVRYNRTIIILVYDTIKY